MKWDYLFTLLEGGLVTLELALASLMLALALGLSAAYCKLSKRAGLVRLANAYTALNRGIPDLVLLLLAFYSLPDFTNQAFEAMGFDIRFDPDPLFCGIATLGGIFGAYMGETFRSAMLAVPPGQREAGLTIGMSPLRTEWRIVIPQVIRLAIPGLTNNWLVLLKATALVSLIGLPDIMFRARGAAESTGQPFTFYAGAGLLYLSATLLSVLLLHMLKRRLNLQGFVR